MQKEIELRPLLWLAAAVLIGLSLRYAPWMLVLAFPLVRSVRTGRNRLGFVVAMVLGFAFAPAPVAEVPGRVDGEVVVHSVPRAGRYGGAYCVVRDGSGMYLLSLKATDDVSMGDVLMVSGTLLSLDPEVAERWQKRGVVGRLGSAASWSKRSEGPWPFRLGLRWRDSFRDFTDRALEAKDSGFIDALCFNVDAALDPGLQRNLSRSGTIHIISASGMHVVLFALGLEWLLVRVPLARPWQLALLMLVLIVYAGAAGLRPPVVRAVLMAGIRLWAYVAKKEYDTLSSLGACALVQVGYDRFSLFDPGFQLSYAIVTGMALFPERSLDVGLYGWIRREFSRSVAATLSAAPLVAYYFGIFSLVAVFGNLLIAPVVGPVVGLALAGWGVGFVAPGLGEALVKSGSTLASWVEAVATALGSPPWAAIEIGGFPGWGVALYYACFLALWRFKPRQIREGKHTA